MRFCCVPLLLLGPCGFNAGKQTAEVLPLFHAALLDCCPPPASDGMHLRLHDYLLTL